MWAIGRQLSQIKARAAHLEPQLDAIRSHLSAGLPAGGVLATQQAQVARAMVAAAMLAPLEVKVRELTLALSAAARDLGHRAEWPRPRERDERFRERQRMLSYGASFAEAKDIVDRLVRKLVDIAALTTMPDLRKLIEDSLDLAAKLDEAADDADALSGLLHGASQGDAVVMVSPATHSGTGETSALGLLKLEQSVALFWILFLILSKWGRRE